jgi:AraC-like DNA-binding protein
MLYFPERTKLRNSRQNYSIAMISTACDHHPNLPARKIHRLLAYLENVGLDPVTLAKRAKIDLAKIILTTAEDKIPSIYYALIYNEAVSELQRRGKNIPWAAGLGSRAFRMMCYCVISCKTLGEALHRASEFCALTSPITGQQLHFTAENNKTSKLVYEVNENSVSKAFAPTNWSMDDCISVVKSSGLETWIGFCGWLIGRRIDAIKVSISGNMLSESYLDRLRDVFQCPIQFNAESSYVEISDDLLQHRIVHDVDSVTEFLNTGFYMLWSTDDKIVSTTAAIKSLLGTNFKNGIPSFEAMASILYMSPSTLRRHLICEGSSYQKIKDERRRDIAIELLCMGDKKICDIGEEIGFADTSSFVRSFRGWMGVTPKVYRDQLQNRDHRI